MADDKNMPALVSNGSEKPVETLAADHLGANDATEAPAVGRADNQPANEAGGAEDEAENNNEAEEEDDDDDDDYNSAEDSEGSSDGGEDDDQQGSSLTALLLGASGSASADLGDDDDDDEDDDDDFVASKPVKKPVRMAASAKRGREEGDPEPARKKTKV